MCIRDSPPTCPALAGALSYAAAAASDASFPPLASSRKQPAPKKKKSSTTILTQHKPAATKSASAPAPKEPRQPTTTPRPDNGIMYRVPPPTPQAPSTEEGSSDPTFADRLRVWVETLIPQILAAKDVQSLLVTILTSLMTLLPLNV